MCPTCRSTPSRGGMEGQIKLFPPTSTMVSPYDITCADQQGVTRGCEGGGHRTRPSWYLLTTDDKMIPPPAQRFISQRAGATVVEVAGSHAIFVSQPQAVAALLK